MELTSVPQTVDCVHAKLYKGDFFACPSVRMPICLMPLVVKGHSHFSSPSFHLYSSLTRCQLLIVSEKLSDVIISEKLDHRLGHKITVTLALERVHNTRMCL